MKSKANLEAAQTVNDKLLKSAKNLSNNASTPNRRKLAKQIAVEVASRTESELTPSTLWKHLLKIVVSWIKSLLKGNILVYKPKEATSASKVAKTNCHPV